MSIGRTEWMPNTLDGSGLNMHCMYQVYVDLGKYATKCNKYLAFYSFVINLQDPYYGILYLKGFYLRRRSQNP
jgi:hypothetical protein